MNMHEYRVTHRVGGLTHRTIIWARTAESALARLEAALRREPDVITVESRPLAVAAISERTAEAIAVAAGIGRKAA